MRDGIKIAGVTLLLVLLAANLGIEVDRALSSRLIEHAQQGQTPRNTQSDSKEQAAANNTAITGGLSPSIASEKQIADAEPSGTQTSENRESRSYSWIDAYLSRANSLSTAAVAILTVGVIAVGIAQRGVAKEVMQRQLRAYVGPTKIGFNVSATNTPISILVEIRNFGVTPAHKFQASLHTEWHVHPLPEGVSFEDRAFTGRTDSLMPGNVSVVMCELPPSVPLAFLYQTITGGSHALYVFGTIAYTDVFGRSHRTNVRKLAVGNRIATNSPFIDDTTGNSAT